MTRTARQRVRGVLRRAVVQLTSRQQDGAGSERLQRLDERQRDIQLQLGCLLAQQARLVQPRTLRDAEFKVFSQFGEDGILQFLIRTLEPKPEVFVEFGVEDYTEANTLFLLLHDNWRGLVLDGSQEAMAAVRARPMYWRHDLQAVAAFVNRDNIDALIAAQGLSGDIGVLSIDIDGNDYWVWERLEVVRPAIVVVEYNSVFGSRRAVSVPYAHDFQRTRAHPSNLYWGCSLAALCHLAERKGYVFVGSNSAGNNAFFVRKGSERGLPVLTAAEGYVESRFRESRNASGELTFLSGAERLNAIRDMPLVDVTTGETVPAAHLVSPAA